MRFSVYFSMWVIRMSSDAEADFSTLVGFALLLEMNAEQKKESFAGNWMSKMKIWIETICHENC